MTINANQLMTGAAVALGAFALWYVFRGPGKAAATQPAATASGQRAAGVASYFSTLTGQNMALYQESLFESGAVMRALGVTP
jgi:hypothetical protein